MYDPSWFSSGGHCQASRYCPCPSHVLLCGNRMSQRSPRRWRTGGSKNMSRSEHLVLLVKDQSYMSRPSWECFVCFELMLRWCLDIRVKEPAKSSFGFFFLTPLVLFSNSLHLVQFRLSPFVIGNMLSKRTVHFYVPMFLLVNKHQRGELSVLRSCGC